MLLMSAKPPGTRSFIRGKYVINEWNGYQIIIIIIIICDVRSGLLPVLCRNNRPDKKPQPPGRIDHPGISEYSRLSGYRERP
jgi:hypothetical protein